MKFKRQKKSGYYNIPPDILSAIQGRPETDWSPAHAPRLLRRMYVARVRLKVRARENADRD
ncbi:hypothetical protein KCP75_21140 [Salmonella enterica subsp. enterica]|nr:hypothetical protein KCP75_21140 [Salmonella enterica subsp. enterica]